MEKFCITIVCCFGLRSAQSWVQVEIVSSFDSCVCVLVHDSYTATGHHIDDLLQLPHHEKAFLLTVPLYDNNEQLLVSQECH